MTTQAPIKAEQAGTEYFYNHPAADHATAERVARNLYATVLEQECFVAGWNKAFWRT